jgi:hypothetical protein
MYFATLERRYVGSRQHVKTSKFVRGPVYNRTMTLDAILSAIDAEIHKLQQARAVLTNGLAPYVKRGSGRPKKVVETVSTKSPKKRVLSEEARGKIAAAQKKRWAAAKKSK